MYQDSWKSMEVSKNSLAKVSYFTFYFISIKVQSSINNLKRKSFTEKKLTGSNITDWWAQLFVSYKNNMCHHCLTGVEKLNDEERSRRIHLQRWNKWDAPKDVLLVGKCLEHLAEYEMTPRQYNKQDSGYWGTSIKESRAKRQSICNQLPQENLVAGGLNVENMTAQEIKSNLRERG